MVKNAIKKIFWRASACAAACVLAVGFGLLLPLLSRGITFAAAESVVSGEDGTYEVPVKLDLKMGADNFTNPVTVEKQDGRYYMTFGYSSQIGYIKLNLEGMDVGSTTEKKNGTTYVTYTLSENNLKSRLSFSAYINAMARETSFGATLDIASAKKTSEAIRDIGERPAEFVPLIETDSAAEYSLKVGTVFPVPEATATLGEKTCAVTAEAFYGKETAEISDGRLELKNVGEYTLVYRAESAEYKTSLGNDTYSEFIVTIRATAGESELVKTLDKLGTLPKNASVVAGKASESSAVYKKAASAMKNISENFEVFSVELLSAEGESVSASGKFGLLFRADDFFDRTKAEVYIMDENGGIRKLTSSGYGRYVLAETEETGIFIVCVAGVSFRMPMWGYALIVAGAAILAAGAITATVIVIKRKRARKI